VTEQRVAAVDVWPYRRAGGTIEFLMLHRVGSADYPAFWQGVSGRIEDGETAWHAAIRELDEETGTTPVAVHAIDPVFSIYDALTDRVSTIIPFAAEIAADAEVTLSDEHDEMRWERLAEAVELVPFHLQKECLRRLAADVLERPELAHLYRVPFATPSTGGTG